ncbi:MAG: lipopolysaccharide kinase InaA family protein, partial [Lysobacterales bacterium]
QEFQLPRRLRQQGLAVPEPIAARWQRRGLVYRASLLTRWLGEVRSLLSVLADGADPARLLPPVAQAVAQLHQRGVWHADLNATNIQIEGQDRVWLIDFDRARDRVTDSRRLAGNLERLRRSLRKYLPAPRLAAVEACWPAFVSHYQAARAERQ